MRKVMAVIAVLNLLSAMALAWAALGVYTQDIHEASAYYELTYQKVIQVDEHAFQEWAQRNGSPVASPLHYIMGSGMKDRGTAIFCISAYLFVQGLAVLGALWVMTLKKRRA